MEFEKLIQQKASYIIDTRVWVEPRIQDDQVPGLAEVLALRELGRPIPPELQPYENLRQSLRRRSFC